MFSETILALTTEQQTMLFDTPRFRRAWSTYLTASDLAGHYNFHVLDRTRSQDAAMQAAYRCMRKATRAVNAIGAEFAKVVS